MTATPRSVSTVGHSTVSTTTLAAQKQPYTVYVCVRMLTWKLIRGNHVRWRYCCCCCCCCNIKSHNQVRSHRTGSSHSGAEEYPRENTHTTQRGTRIYHSSRNSCLHQKHIKVKSGVSLRCARSTCRSVRLITHAWRNQLFRLPPKEDYHVYITRSIYHYAYAR